MSLTNRLSLYFLAALGVVLIGFSLTLYVLVRWHLYAQLDERLDAAIESLVAAVEVHPNDVQWEPQERRITLGDDAAADQPRWALQDLSGELKDRSFNLSASPIATETQLHGWYVSTRRMRAGNFATETIEGQETPRWYANLGETSLGATATVSLADDRTFLSDGLVLTVAVSEAPVTAMLRWLAFVLTTVSALTWTIATLVGRWLCRRALRPISHMAESAQSIRTRSAAPNMLDVPSTNDELEHLGKSFNDLLASLRESLERQRRFTGDASHQLRTPLTAMLASVEVALRHERSPAEYQRVLETVSRRGGQLRRIIESLLFLARSDGSSLLDNPEQVDLNSWCQSWLEGWAEHARAKDFKFRAAPGEALVTTHPGLVGQVLDNLLDNACNYSDPGTPIIVEIEKASHGVSVIVRDAGCGIAKDQLAAIFEPFYRASEARWQGKQGVGLGLAVVNRLVAILGGKIEVTSEPGKGSCFRVILATDGESLTPSEVSRDELAIPAQTMKAE